MQDTFAIHRLFALTALGCLWPTAGHAVPAAAPAWHRPLLDLGVQEIIFTQRAEGRDEWHYYANFGYELAPEPWKVPKGDAWRYAGHSDRRYGTVWKYGGKGGRLCRMDLSAGKIAAILDDPAGDVRDPCVHSDARKILFSYRKGGTHYYHLHEINADGTGLREITTGPWDDIEPSYLSDGDIVFVSSRCKRFVPCWKTNVATLHRCRPDGSKLRALSSNVEHDNTPWMLSDGRVIYTRWEYLDRCDMTFHHLWAMNPDGTGQTAFFGNMHPGNVMIDAKPIPGTNHVVAIFSHGHDRDGHGAPEHRGAIVVVDPGNGPDHRPSARYITPEVTTSYSGFRDPWPLTEDLFLAVEDANKHCRLVLLDATGHQEVLHQVAVPGKDALLLHEPRPLVVRPREPVLAARSDLSKATGRLVLADVAHGRNMAGVGRGEVKRLLVLEQLPKPWNGNAGPDMITFGSHLWGQAGAFTLSRILGTVPVEADGSAYFEAPALRSLFFVALDEHDLCVKRMQSFVTLMPGETTGCVGCHERRVEAPRQNGDLLAMRRRPSPVEPVPGVPEVMDFLRDIQPILDRHCVRCHDGNPQTGEGGAIDLSNRPGQWGRDPRRYAQSYLTLVTRRQNDWVSHAWNMGGNRPPRTLGSSASKLIKLVDGSHYQAKLSDHDRTLIRLWIDTSAVYAGTYAALGGMEGPYHLPTFKPNEHYVREMKRYGVLPPGFDSTKDRLDVYEVDRAYWRSFWHRPEKP